MQTNILTFVWLHNSLTVWVTSILWPQNVRQRREKADKRGLKRDTPLTLHIMGSNTQPVKTHARIMWLWGLKNVGIKQTQRVWWKDSMELHDGKCLTHTRDWKSGHLNLWYFDFDHFSVFRKPPQLIESVKKLKTLKVLLLNRLAQQTTQAS